MTRKLLSAALLAATIAIAACGGGDDDDDSASALMEGQLPVTEEQLSADEVAKWPETWCSIEPGVSRDDLVAAMGEPTSETSQNVSWYGFGYSFAAFLDVDGNVWQMDGHGPTEDSVSCESARRVPGATP
jgi:hypothetical protein